MNKLTNEENYKNYQKRKLLRWLVMLFAFLTILFVIIYYVTWNYGFVFVALVFFVLNVVLAKVRERIPINLSEENQKEKDEMKNKKKKKKTTTKKKSK